MMLSKVVFFVCSVIFVSALSYDEGDSCEQDGLTGKCVNILQCPTALQNMKNKKPLICTFSGTNPVVCCFDNVPTSSVTEAFKPVATTMRIPQTTTEYIPPVADYVDNTRGNSTDNRFGSTGACEPVHPSLTAPKNGRKAWDKCIDYQEKFVHACERSVTLAATASMSRVNNCHHTADELIIGGQTAAEYEFPHMAMVGYGDKPDINWLCGGSIISENFILTAGHCVSHRNFGDATYIVIGVHTRSDAENDSKVYRIKRTIRHPEYKPPSKYNDIALMETETPMKLNQYTVPACLNTDSEVNDKKALATGWGLTVNGGQELSPRLQKVILAKFTTPECSQKFPDNRNMRRGFDAQTQICFGDKSASKDTCQGDSGGPLQVKSKKLNCMYMIVGVTSFGKACGFVGDPGIYTRVEPYVPWIESVVWP